MDSPYPQVDRDHPLRWNINASGKYFTTTNCVDCGNCSRHCPSCFARHSFPNHWYVKKQPTTPLEIEQMEKAMKYCKGKCIKKDDSQ
ncbi:4Fe-4S ferredoxin-type domain-containing protein [Entamoeba marina]